MNFFEAVLDRLFWMFVILVAIVLATIICTVDFFFALFFPKTYKEFQDRFFGAPADQAINNYENFARDHPILCWIFRWPLALLSI
jgi:hypothetical protein